MNTSPHPNSPVRTDPELEKRRKNVLQAIRNGARRNVQIREIASLDDRQVDSILKHLRKLGIVAYTHAEGWKPVK